SARGRAALHSRSLRCPPARYFANSHSTRITLPILPRTFPVIVYRWPLRAFASESTATALKLHCTPLHSLTCNRAYAFPHEPLSILSSVPATTICLSLYFLSAAS